MAFTRLPPTVFGAPGFTLGTTNTAGSSGVAVDSDATVLAFDTTAPTNEAFGDSAAVGSATVAARRDHLHGMPAAPKDVFAAARWTGSALLTGSINTTSITEDTTGVHTWTIATDFGNINWFPVGSVETGIDRNLIFGTATVGTIVVETFSQAGANVTTGWGAIGVASG